MCEKLLKTHYSFYCIDQRDKIEKPPKNLQLEIFGDKKLWLINNDVKYD